MKIDFLETSCFLILYFFIKLENTKIVVFQIIHNKNKSLVWLTECYVFIPFHIFNLSQIRHFFSILKKNVFNKHVSLFFYGKISLE
jgi:hypothetical protein